MPMKKRIAAALIVVTAFVLAACGQLKQLPAYNSKTNYYYY